MAINNITVIGSGLMGRGIAQVAAQGGYEIQSGPAKGLGIRFEGNNMNKPVYRELQNEISELVEPHIYPLIVAQLKAFQQRRAKAVALPHPAVKRR